VCPRASQRIALDLIARPPIGGADLVLIRVAPLTLHTALHLLSEIARRLLQLIECFGLRADRLAGLTALQGLGGVAHRPLRTAQRLGNIARPVAAMAHQRTDHAAGAFLLSGLV